MHTISLKDCESLALWSLQGAVENDSSTKDLVLQDLLGHGGHQYYRGNLTFTTPSRVAVYACPCNLKHLQSF